MTSSDTVYCTSCGAANRIQATYCFSCGQLIQRGTSAPSSFPPAPPASETGRLRIGHILKQRYKIISLLGQGGMGAVYKAEDIQFGNRLIAAKEMSLSRLNPLEMDHAVKQFKQEAYLLAGLKHPNLPSIYDYFEEDKRWYLIMDFIDGQTLEEYIQTKPNQILPVKEALDLAIQLSKVLNYLHTRSPQIIFRDLKPLNIMITPEKHLYLIDFGIARLFKPGQEKDTVAYFSAGYTAPEQFGTAQTAPQSDVYSLGATLHRILSGKEPRLNQPPFNFKPLDIYHSSLPPSLVALVAQMVKADMKQRPESMVVVKQELENIQQQVLYNKPLQTSHTPQQPFSPPQSFLAPPPPPQSPSLPQSQYNFNANVPPALAH